MSLACAVFNEVEGFLISEGRAGRKHADGSFEPVLDTCFKGVQLSPDLAISTCGESLDCAVRVRQRTQEAVNGGATFPRLRRLIPAFMHQENRDGAVLSIMLLGRDGDRVRLVSWQMHAPHFKEQEVQPDGILEVVHTCDEVRADFLKEVRPFPPSETRVGLVAEEIARAIRVTATRHPQINDRIQFCRVSVHGDAHCISDSTTTVIRADGAAHSQIKATWTRSTDQLVIAGGNIEMWIKKHTDPDTAYKLDGYADGADTEYFFNKNIVDGTEYDIKIRALNSHGKASAWSSVQTVTATGSTSFPYSSIPDITNSNFEASPVQQPPLGWGLVDTTAVSALSWETSSMYQGNRSIKITNSGTDATQGVESLFKIAVKPGDLLTISAAIKKIAGAAAPFITVQPYNANGNKLIPDPWPIYSSSSSSWAVVEGTFIMPPTSVYATIQCLVTGTNASGEFDSIQVSRVPSVLPAPTSSVLGGVKSLAAVSGKYVSGIDSTGTPTTADLPASVPTIVNRPTLPSYAFYAPVFDCSSTTYAGCTATSDENNSSTADYDIYGFASITASNSAVLTVTHAGGGGFYSGWIKLFYSLNAGGNWTQIGSTHSPSYSKMTETVTLTTPFSPSLLRFRLEVFCDTDHSGSETVTANLYDIYLTQS